MHCMHLVMCINAHNMHAVYAMHVTAWLPACFIAILPACPDSIWDP